MPSTHADGMVAQAKDYIAKLTEESELVRQAQETCQPGYPNGQ